MVGTDYEMVARRQRERHERHESDVAQRVADSLAMIGWLRQIQAGQVPEEASHVNEVSIIGALYRNIRGLANNPTSMPRELRPVIRGDFRCDASVESVLDELEAIVRANKVCADERPRNEKSEERHRARALCHELVARLVNQPIKSKEGVLA